jgi:hypothetical protein
MRPDFLGSAETGVRFDFLHVVSAMDRIPMAGQDPPYSTPLRLATCAEMASISAGLSAS